MTDSEESWLGHVRSCRVSYKDLYVSLAHMGVHGLGTTLRVHNGDPSENSGAAVYQRT